MIKTVIFGTGQYYKNRASEIARMQEVQICAFIDNNPDLNGKKINDIPVSSPDALLQIDYDYVVLMSLYASDMKKQLLNIGIKESRIMFWGEFCAKFCREKIRLYPAKLSVLEKKKRILIISTQFNYNGGALAAVYAAMALKNIGYDVVIAIPSGDRILIEEIIKKGLAIAICPAISYVYEEIEWIKNFDIVIVNVFQMIRCACEISKVRPVLWWIHEPSEIYKPTASEFSDYIDIDVIKRINIVAVSRLAQNNFNQIFKDRIKKTMLFGIPQEAADCCAKKTDNRLVFALIGFISLKKGQIEFLKAASMFPVDKNFDIEFWIIGGNKENEYFTNVKALAENNTNVKILGEKTREELNNIFHDIDVVVCASLEETMSITIVEGMMYRKICITTDATGIAEYIQNGKNGYICRAGDSRNLYEVMKRIKEDYGQLECVKDEARKTYENFFTLESFSERLEQELLWTEKEYQILQNN